MTISWQVEKLGELCEIELGRTPARDNPRFWDAEKTTNNIWLSIADLLNAEDAIAVESREYLSDAGAMLGKPVSPGTLMVSFKLTLGRLAFAGVPLFTNEAIAALPVRNERKLCKRYLYYFLQYFDWNAASVGEEKVKGKTLNKAKLKEIPVCYPSLSEQQRIVGILDEAFAGIATAKANAEKNLQSAHELFEARRQSLLADGRQESWSGTTLGDEIDLLVGFAFKSSGYVESGDSIRLLRGDNIVQGRIRWDDAKRWSSDDVASYQRYALREGDVVLAMDRPWVKAGLKRAVVSKDDLPALLVQRTACLRAGARLDSRYLFHLVSSSAFIQHLLGVQTGSGVPHISGQQIKVFSFACPPLDEQQRMAEDLAALQTEIQRIESIQQRKLAVLDELKQSLLHRAFSSQL